MEQHHLGHHLMAMCCTVISISSGFITIVSAADIQRAGSLVATAVAITSGCFAIRYYYFAIQEKQQLVLEKKMLLQNNSSLLKNNNIMSLTSKANIVKLLTMLVVGLTLFQGMIPTIPNVTAGTITLISAVTMYLVSAGTIWKQFLSSAIADNAKTPTIILAVIATIGGLNSLFDVVHLSASLGQWLRFGITAVTAILNLLSSQFYPVPAKTTT